MYEKQFIVAMYIDYILYPEPFYVNVVVENAKKNKSK